MNARTLRLSAAWPEVPVLYEDETILAVNKPAGLLVAPDRWDKTRANLMGLLQAGIAEGKAWARERGIAYLANAHRLDADTSGVLVLARTREALRALAAQFAARQVRKLYEAILEGVPDRDELTLDGPIAESLSRPGHSVVDRTRGRSARTVIRVKERFAGYAFVEVEIFTGRQHQIRVHAEAAGHPLAGDRAYGGRPLLLSRLKPHYKEKAEGERPLMGRPALHAALLAITHPVDGRERVIEAPAPKDFTVALKYLRKFGMGRASF